MLWHRDSTPRGYNGGYSISSCFDIYQISLAGYQHELIWHTHECISTREYLSFTMMRDRGIYMYLGIPTPNHAQHLCSAQTTHTKHLDEPPASTRHQASSVRWEVVTWALLLGCGTHIECTTRYMKIFDRGRPECELIGIDELRTRTLKGDCYEQLYVIYSQILNSIHVMFELRKYISAKI